MKRITRALLNFSRASYSGPYTFDENGNVNGVTEDMETLHKALKKRFEMSLVEYPDCEEIDFLIENVFKPTDIPMLTHCPVNLTPVEELAERVGLSREATTEICVDMMDRGLIRYLTLNDVELIGVPDYVIGWYEFTLIHLSEGEGRVEAFEERTGTKFEEINEVFGNYMLMYAKGYDPEKFSPVFRAAPHELVKNEDHHVITYESAKGLAENAETIAVMNCACKFHEVVGKGEELPEGMPYKCCMILDYAADMYSKFGKAEVLTKEEALDLLEELKETGHMHHVDTPVDAKVICNCHKDYCGVVKIHRMTGVYPVDRSNFKPVFDTDACKGCGVCTKRCVLDLLELVKIEDELDGGKKKKRRVTRMIDGGEDVCGGCLNCYSGCKFGAIDYVPVPERIEYPADKIESTVFSALRRGKLNTLVFDDPLSTKDRVGRAVMSALENNPIGRMVFRNRAQKLSKKFADKARKKFRKKIGLEDEVEE